MEAMLKSPGCGRGRGVAAGSFTRGPQRNASTRRRQFVTARHRDDGLFSA